MPRYTVTIKTPIGDKKYGMDTPYGPEAAKAEIERQQKLKKSVVAPDGTHVDGEPYFPGGEVTISGDDPGAKPVELLAVNGGKP